MTRLRSTITNALLTLVLVLSVMASVLVASNVQADAADQPVVNETEQMVYIPLTDAPPQRDITQQRLAPIP